jgi:hypothetical protein
MTKLTIPITGRAPALLEADDWPIIASTESWTGQYRNDAGRIWEVEVRAHADGRRIVHGRYITRWQGERDLEVGELVPPEGDLIDVLHGLVEDIGGDDRLVQGVLDSLPPEPLP